MLYIYLGSDLRVSKFSRMSQPDDKLGNGIDYTYVEDQSKFITDNGTLRSASLQFTVCLICSDVYR